MGCPADWPRVVELAGVYEGVHPSFGLHPWFIKKRSAEWMRLLEEFLVEYPEAGVGEIGIDHAIEDRDDADQESVFLAQLELARRLERPVSIHCRQAWGRLIELLDGFGELPRGMLIHCYGGSAEMAQELVEHGYDLRHIYRIILNSEVYQLSSIHNEGNQADESNFSRYYVRRLGAEVLIDAICQLTQTTESYSSDIPEPFTFIPEEQRSIKLSDGSITSPFLDLYGRPPRDTGFESERNNTPSSAQKLHLLNSTHIQRKIVNNKALFGMYYIPQKGKDKKGNPKKPKTAWHAPEKTIENMYLSILSRYPTAQEKRVALDYYHNSGNGRWNAGVDLVWALLNTKEFIYKH